MHLHKKIMIIHPAMIKKTFESDVKALIILNSSDSVEQWHSVRMCITLHHQFISPAFHPCGLRENMHSTCTNCPALQSNSSNLQGEFLCLILKKLVIPIPIFYPGGQKTLASMIVPVQNSRLVTSSWKLFLHLRPLYFVHWQIQLLQLAKLKTHHCKQSTSALLQLNLKHIME